MNILGKAMFFFVLGFFLMTGMVEGSQLSFQLQIAQRPIRLVDVDEGETVRSVVNKVAQKFNLAPNTVKIGGQYGDEIFSLDKKVDELFPIYNIVYRVWGSSPTATSSSSSQPSIVDQLRAENEQLRAKIAELEAENGQLKSQVAEYEQIFQDILAGQEQAGQEE